MQDQTEVAAPKARTEIKEYRIVTYYHGFFCHWAHRLELLRHWKFLWWRGSSWEKVAGNSLETSIPSEWKQLNIVSRITLEPGDE